MKKTYFILIVFIMLFNSCAPTREEALTYYESILRETQPIFKKSLEVTAVLYSYTEDLYDGKITNDTLQLNVIRTYSSQFSELLYKSKENLAKIPATSNGGMLKNAAIEYVNESDNLQALLSKTVLNPLYKQDALKQKDEIKKALEYCMNQFREINLPYFEAMSVYEKENSLFDFDKKAILEKIDNEK